MPKRNSENQTNAIPIKLTRKEYLKEKINEPCKSDIVNEPCKPDMVNEPQTPEKSEPVPSTSSIDEDRYTFNYWQNTETTKTASTNEKEILKIGNLSIGKIEHKSLLVRITYKSEVKDTKFGKVVSFLLLDDSGEIALVTYGKISLDTYKNWEFNQVYSIENFDVQEENVNYPSGSNNSLQIKANPNFIYQKLEQSRAPPISFSFQSIDEIKTLNKNTRVDILGVLLKDYGLEKNANNIPMRDLSVTDQKKGMIIVTLWGPAAEKFKSKENSVIVVRKGVMGQYKENIKINCTIGTLVWSNPTIPEASPILKWFAESTKYN